MSAYLIGVKKMYNLISGINRKSTEQKSKMNLPAICAVVGIGFAAIGVVFLIFGVMAFIGISWAPLLSMAFLLIVNWAMIIYIQRFDGNNFYQGGQPRRGYYLKIVGISLLMIAVIVFIIVIFSATMDSPEINITRDNMAIAGMYGTEIEKTDIIEISLINQPLFFSTKTNGSSISGAYKGNFTSSQYGPVLVYVKDSSIPWISIVRKENKTVLISLQNSNETVRLYSELIAWIDE